MKQHEALIAGGGPAGLMLAGELALAGIDVAIVERRLNQELTGSRAGGLHARTLEIFDQRGIADKFVTRGRVVHAVQFAGISLDISDFPTRRPYTLALSQNHIERILGEWVRDMTVPVYWGREVTGFVQDDTGIDVEVHPGPRLRTQYLVGCDGGRSLVRRTAAIAFEGWDATTSSLIAEVEVTQEPAWGLRRDSYGLHGISRMDGRSTVRVMLTEPVLGPKEHPTLDDLRNGLVAVFGCDYGVHSPTWISRFTDATRQAKAYRDRRVLLAGDAAHIHAPDAGQGLNTGLQDAVNLGWKLGQVIRGTSPATLLDSYHDERHPVGARVLHTTMQAVALRRADERTKALREWVAELLAMDEPRKRLAGQLSGLDIRYPLGEGSPLLGRRMPDIDLTTATGVRHVYELLHQAPPVLLNFSQPGRLAIPDWARRVRLVDATCDPSWQLPVVGSVDAPLAALVRPDGHVAWVGEGGQPGLEQALAAWCASREEQSA